MLGCRAVMCHPDRCIHDTEPQDQGQGHGLEDTHTIKKPTTNVACFRFQSTISSWHLCCRRRSTMQHMLRRLHGAQRCNTVFLRAPVPWRMYSNMVDDGEYIRCNLPFSIHLFSVSWLDDFYLVAVLLYSIGFSFFDCWFCFTVDSKTYEVL